MKPWQIALAGGLSCAMLVLWLGHRPLPAAATPPGPPAAASPAPPAPAPADDALAGVGGDFTLQGEDGPVASTSLRGNFVVIYFGYTHCPDVCPTTLSNLAGAFDSLPAAARAHLRALFITIDPERDTPQLTGEYARAFGPAFTGLSGSLSEVTQVAQNYHVYFAKLPERDGGYAMEHSSVLYLLRPDGRLAGFVPADLPPEALARRLRELGV